MMTGISIILQTLIQDKNISPEEISKGSDVPVEELKSLVEGKGKLTIDTALKLSNFFEIPGEFFFVDPTMVNHNNYGEKSNSNSGYIGTYRNN
ncbi:helix-turn-helix transcriptional regulator [Negadavirga shengliensis]|uniref:Transcriptional regulator n=1 Tax=Negadavirga shengliensis TaxID=1389218 RepID=A0ABV9T9G3_9BACT